MAKKIVPPYVRLIHEIANGEDCRPDWAAHVKEELARDSGDSHSDRAPIRLAYVNANAPSHQQPEPDYVLKCRVYDEAVRTGEFWRDSDAVYKSIRAIDAKAAVDASRPKPRLAWSRD